MKNQKLLLIFAVCAILCTACQSDQTEEPIQEEGKVNPEILAKLDAAYFDISRAFETTFMGEEGVAVEDMFFTYAQIDELAPVDSQAKHYRTTNLVTSLPRTITISVDPDLGTLGSNALDETIRMYNTLGLQISFTRVAFGQRGRNKADIEVTEFFEFESGGFITLGRAAGFPTRKGDPAKGFGINSRWFQLSIAPNVNELAGTMAHEIGHCIGLRHTDYQTRQSCGQNVNEGSAGVGAIYIPGTPTGSDFNSIMQSCGPAIDFNNNDVTALNVLY
ncbi:dual-action HEIGH metallo-peptidase [Kordia sp. SMS9]|uniref:M57 family metalloprotease n=1 Tax=Kordia sp. SMS9 TaxID=2282170 RepID=UPI000E0D298C|nr:M57 family metalloprotease [Kordia sp. SMS9]AXG70117.1 dual-action HEIGH metallo-peptidase [Kordia sp. SMS9]